MTRLRHYDSFDTARFITFSCYQRQKLIVSELEMNTISRHLCQIREQNHFKLHGYVLMPNHVHLVLTPSPNSKLGIEIGKMKARIAKEILSIWRNDDHEIPLREAIKVHNIGQPVFWHRRFYDHNCRTIETAREKINYCHNNPVEGGLASSPEEWKYSSYNWYIGKRNVPVPIDEIEV